MYLEIFLADFAVFRVFWGISRDFAEIPEIRGSATARNIRSPVFFRKFTFYIVVNNLFLSYLSAHVKIHENQGSQFERNYIDAKQQKCDEHGVSFQLHFPQFSRSLLGTPETIILLEHTHETR